MSGDASNPSEYIHGSSPEEQDRLSLLNDILNDACLRELDLQPADSVLDVGSGLGQFTRLIARTVGDGGRVVGVERDPDQLLEARRLAAGSGEPNLVEFRSGDAFDLPLQPAEEGSFDVAHARFVLEHLPRPLDAVSQMVRAVRPGGRVVVSDDDHDNIRPWPEPSGFGPLWEAYVRSYERLGNNPYVGRHLVSLLHDAGLVDIRNSCVFFGGCGGNERFEAIADNLIGVLHGAKAEILSEGRLDEASFDSGIDGLRRWKADPSAALWYTVSWAEGRVPDTTPHAGPTRPDSA